MIRTKFTKQILLLLLISIAASILLTFVLISNISVINPSVPVAYTSVEKKVIAVCCENPLEENQFNLSTKIFTDLNANTNLCVLLNPPKDEVWDILIQIQPNSASISNQRVVTQVYFSDETTARLLNQYLFANLYSDSAIALVGDFTGLQREVAASLDALLQKSGQVMQYHQFSNDVNPVDLMSYSAVVVFDENTQVLSALNAMGFKGLRLSHGFSQKSLIYIQDAKLDAYVYKDQDEFAKRIAQTAVTLLTSDIIAPAEEIYQRLLNINNINSYLQENGI